MIRLAGSTLPGSGAGPGTGHTGTGFPARARAAADVPVAGYAYVGPLSVLLAPTVALIEDGVPDGVADGLGGALCPDTGIASGEAARLNSREAAMARGNLREVMGNNLDSENGRYGNRRHCLSDFIIVLSRPLHTPVSSIRPADMSATPTVPEDFDGFFLDFIPVHDGIWSLSGIDDDRPIAAWSRPHAERYDQRLTEATAREKVAEWALGDVTTKNLPACIAKAEATLAAARAARAMWAERLRVVNTFRPE